MNKNKQFPYVIDYINQTLIDEKECFDKNEFLQNLDFYLQNSANSKHRF